MFFTNNDNLDTISEVSGDIAVRKEDTARLYRTYNFAYRPKSNLAILSMRNKVVSMIASNSVVSCSLLHKSQRSQARKIRKQ